MANRKQCSFCPEDAATHVHGESDVFPCCRDCEQAWETNPGFVSWRERKELIDFPGVGTVPDMNRAAHQGAGEP